MLSSQLSILVISSPSPSHPTTHLIDSFLSSLSFVPELNDPSIPILFILDGYQISSENRTKKGRVTSSLATNYEEYKIVLDNYMNYSSRGANYRVHCLDSHHGFAHAVRIGLTLIQTTYCLIAQHDRVFMSEFQGIQAILDVMENQSHIRYVGFPSVNNITHNTVIQSRYRLNRLNASDMIISVPINDSTYLQPLIFWFDSQHLCHVQRYLEIYKPCQNLPPELRHVFGMKLIGSMLLRRGDFIEDRFGQCQLKSLTSLREYDDDDEMLLKAFLWYGSYLIWIPDEPYQQRNEDESVSLAYRCPLINHRAKTLVRHKNGRILDLEREAHYEAYRAQHKMKDDMDSNLAITTTNNTATATASSISTTSSDDIDVDEIYSLSELLITHDDLHDHEAKDLEEVI